MTDSIRSKVEQSLSLRNRLHMIQVVAHVSSSYSNVNCYLYNFILQKATIVGEATLELLKVKSPSEFTMPDFDKYAIAPISRFRRVVLFIFLIFFVRRISSREFNIPKSGGQCAY